MFCRWEIGLKIKSFNWDSNPGNPCVQGLFTTEEPKFVLNYSGPKIVQTQKYSINAGPAAGLFESSILDIGFY